MVYVVVGFGRALKELRERRGLSQQEVQFRSHLPKGSVSRFERGRALPTITSLSTLLEDGLRCTLHDLADVLDELHGLAPLPKPGQPRPAWVEVLRRRGIDEDVLFGVAYGALEPGDAQGEADLVASAAEAASAMALEILDQRRAASEAAEEVAEPLSESDSRSRSSAQKSGRRKRSPR